MNDTEEEKLIFLQWSVAHQILSVEMMKVIENENAGFFPNSDDVHHRKRCFSTAM
jgi:hypothetical protein